MRTLSDLAGPKREWNTALQDWKTSSHERSRLEMPKTGSTETLAAKLLGAQASAVEDDRGITDLLIQGLVDRLPKPDSVWSLEDRAKWLRTAASIFGLVYKGNEEDGEIAVAIVKHEVTKQPIE